MADNVELNPGSGGAVIAADDVGGVLYPRNKVGFGVDGEYADVSDGSPLPITDANTQAILQAINGLNDTMVTLLSAMLEKMPRVTGNDQMAVSIEAGSVGIATSQTLSALGTINGHGGKFVSGDNLAMAGATYLYDRITVS